MKEGSGTVLHTKCIRKSLRPFPLSVKPHPFSIVLERDKGVTLHSGLYSHPRPGSRSWPIKFSCLTPWLHQKFSLDPWLFSINHTHWVPGEALTISKLVWAVCLTPWPASKFHHDHLTSLWPRSWVGVQSPMQCHPLERLLALPVNRSVFDLDFC